MRNYPKESKATIAVDCIIFGFDGEFFKILLIKRGFKPLRGEWSLMGGFVGNSENADQAAQRILSELTGLKEVYLKQFKTYSSPQRDPIERTISIAYYALIDIHRYEKQISEEYHAEWFIVKGIPDLIFDHNQMVDDAKQKLRYDAALHPILFELLPDKFTIPQLQHLYEQIYNVQIDNRNFIRKLNASGLLVKLNEKDKSASKKGAFYFKLNMTEYKAKFQSLLSLVPAPDSLIS
ncbi:NUDIX hydrolase [Sphingobacterium spiritivorum]|uniref:NUDIX hydrolase n=1 Tax=Sphingobacterium spiritivorum TaxID=258 RepID=UPI003DA3D468